MWKLTCSLFPLLLVLLIFILTILANVLQLRSHNPFVKQGFIGALICCCNRYILHFAKRNTAKEKILMFNGN